MADGNEGGASSPEQGNTPQKRAPGAPKEIFDELAQDPKRYSILDAMQMLKKGKQNLISRLLTVSRIADGAKLPDIEEDFRAKIASFNRNGANAATTALLTEVTNFKVEDILVTGFLYSVAGYMVHFLEAPTESLFYVLQNLHPHLVSTKVLYMTECHGVRVTSGWQAFSGQNKFGTVLPDDLTVAERIFGVYKKFLELHGLPGRQDADFYRSNSDAYPHLQDIEKLFDPATNPDAFPLDAYLQFYCVGGFPNDDFLHSELLWPVPPPLSYYEDGEASPKTAAAAGG